MCVCVSLLSNFTSQSAVLCVLYPLSCVFSVWFVCVFQVPLSSSLSQVRLHSSNPNLCAELGDFQTPVTRLTDGVDGAGDYIKLQEDFCVIAQKGKQNITLPSVTHQQTKIQRRSSEK